MSESKSAQDALDEKVEVLLNEFSEHRNEIKKMIKELEVIREKVDTLFPERLDARFVRFFEEKVKSATSLFSALLEMRKEIGKSLKDEIELRRKYAKKSDIENLEEILDIRSMVDRLEEFSLEKDKIKKLRREITSKEKIEGIYIPGIDDVEQITETEGEA